VRRIVLGWALILYGVAGLVLVAAGAAIGLEVAGRIERLAAAADGTLAAASSSTRAAADAFGSVDGSLAESQASAESGGDLAREASGTFASLAATMELRILGTQPLLPLAADFETSAEQASALADTLDRVGSSLEGTRTDVASIGDELDVLALELETLRSETGAAGNGGTPPIRLFVLLLLAWMLVPALGGLLAGLTLISLRRLRPSPAADG
jgi:hypothetical protein